MLRSLPPFFLPIYPNTDWFAIIGWPDKSNRKGTNARLPFFPLPFRHVFRDIGMLLHNIITLKFARATRELTYRVVSTTLTAFFFLFDRDVSRPTVKIRETNLG